MQNTFIEEALKKQKWIKTGLNYHAIKNKKLFQNLPTVLELNDKRTVRIDNSGMKIVNP